MGCVSSNLLNNDEEFSQFTSTALSHHIVSLTSTTYGLLNLDPPPPPPPPSTTTTTTTTTAPNPPPRIALGSVFPTPLSDPPKLLRSERLEVINSWELMSGLDAESFRFSPIFVKKTPNGFNSNKENSSPNLPARTDTKSTCELKPANGGAMLLDGFEKLCPPNGENKVVIYTTTLRGVRRTFEACNVVRSALEGFGVWVCERDVSMDKGFREELRELMKGKEKEAMLPPRVFIKGRYLGGAEEVLRIVEDGWMGEVLEGLPKKKAGDVCDGCGNVRFLPCFSCNGSCKMVATGEKETQGRTAVIRCPDCNENGLVLCPICS